MRKILTLIVISFLSYCTYAQETISTAGGNATGSGGNVSYTIGQLVYTTNSGSNGSISQGVQQPYEISVVSSIEDSEGIELMVSVYPNPTQDILTLSTENFEQKNMLYQLYSISGNLLETKQINNSETRIYLQDYNPSIYFLKLINNDKEIKTFKIIKK
jgi:hypothetical protein